MFILPKISKVLTCDHTGNDYFPFTRWILAANVDDVKVLVNVLNRSSANFVVTPAYQTANDPINPDSWANFASGQITSAGLTCTGVEDLSSATSAKYFVRFGMGAKNSTGGFQTGTVEMTVTGRA